MTAWVQFAEATALLFPFAHVYAKGLCALGDYITRRRHQ